MPALSDKVRDKARSVKPQTCEPLQYLNRLCLYISLLDLSVKPYILGRETFSISNYHYTVAETERLSICLVSG